MDERVEVGATVLATDGEVGTVEAIVADQTSGEPSLLVVRTRAGERVEVPIALVAADSTGREVRLSVAHGALTAGMTALNVVGDRLTVPVREEVLVPTTHPIELGTVRIHKRIETVPAETMVEVMRDEVAVERVAIDRQVDAVPAPRHEGETLVIPVVEEVLVTEKRLLLREEIRVTRRQVSQSVPVRDTVRREVIEIEELHADQTGAGGPAGVDTAATGPGTGGDLPLT